MNKQVAAAYDRLPYPSGPHFYSHPGHVGMLAQLAGAKPAQLDNCRVLEIGGSDGGNLLPIAIDFPTSEFVCLDISRVQIEMGRRHASALGVKNIDWHAADLTQFDFEPLGKFDYIIAHGVYSWVDASVQNKLLELYREILSSQGIGYISYNTYPGWHAQMALREMMLAHVEGIADDDRRVEAVLDLVHRIANSSQGHDTPIATVARSFVDSMADFESVPVYITHEFLSENNSPIYYREFANRASMFGLQVVGDANHVEHSLDRLSDESRDWILQQSDDPVVQGQYMDFLSSGAFRRSLLCRREVKIDWNFSVSKWEKLFVSANVRPIDDSGERWSTGSGNTFSTSHQLAQGVLTRLSDAWPGSIQVAQIARSCSVATEPIAKIVESMFQQKIVEGRLANQQCVNQASDRPRASRFCRHQATGGYVTTQRHSRVRMDDEQAIAVLPLVDGTRTIQQIAVDAKLSVDDTIKHLEQMAQLGLLVA